MGSKDFRRAMAGYGLTTAEILYRLPDHPAILTLPETSYLKCLICRVGQ